MSSWLASGGDSGRSDPFSNASFARVRSFSLKTLPFDSGSFDFVHIRWVNLGVPEAGWQDLLEEVARILKKGTGILEVSLPFFSSLFFVTRADLGFLSSTLLTRSSKPPTLFLRQLLSSLLLQHPAHQPSPPLQPNLLRAAPSDLATTNKPLPTPLTPLPPPLRHLLRLVIIHLPPPSRTRPQETMRSEALLYLHLLQLEELRIRSSSERITSDTSRRISSSRRRASLCDPRC